YGKDCPPGAVRVVVDQSNEIFLESLQHQRLPDQLSFGNETDGLDELDDVSGTDLVVSLLPLRLPLRHHPCPLFPMAAIPAHPAGLAVPLLAPPCDFLASRAIALGDPQRSSRRAYAGRRAPSPPCSDPCPRPLSDASVPRVGRPRPLEPPAGAE